MKDQHTLNVILFVLMIAVTYFMCVGLWRIFGIRHNEQKSHYRRVEHWSRLIKEMELRKKYYAIIVLTEKYPSEEVMRLRRAFEITFRDWLEFESMDGNQLIPTMDKLSTAISQQTALTIQEQNNV
jgi:hypothetical protein